MNEWGIAPEQLAHSSAGGSHCESVALTRLDDQQLEASLRGLLGASARIEVQIALHLVEVEERRLHWRAGHSSLYEYCRERLGLSEFEAYLRICAARIGREFPIAFELLGARALHLSTLHLLRDYLTSENHRQLLAEASYKSKRQVAELLARRFPRADVATTLRSLPRLEPLSPERFRLELTIVARLHQKLERARDLLSHANPTGDLGVVIERGLDELLVKLEKRSFAARDSCAPVIATERIPAPPANEHSLPVQRRARKHIANAVRRDVAARDEHRCTFTSEAGHRCGARAFLQLHHERAFARGGDDSRENLRWLCAAHNRLLAEREFGTESVREAIVRRTVGRVEQPCPDKSVVFIERHGLCGESAPHPNGRKS